MNEGDKRDNNIYSQIKNITNRQFKNARRKLKTYLK